MIQKLIRLVGAVLIFAPSVVWGLDVGQLKMYSVLNEPLRAEVALVGVGHVSPDLISASLGSDAAFARAHILHSAVLDTIRFRVKRTAQGVVVLMSTPGSIEEPFLDFILRVRWPGGVIEREYTILMDPPILSGKRTPSLFMPTLDVSDESTLPPLPQPNSPAVVKKIKKKITKAKPIKTPTVKTNKSVKAVKPKQHASSRVKYTGKTIKVRHADTLWSIARRFRDNTGYAKHASIQQVVLALHRKNPSAFLRGNINGLMRGVRLRVPTAADLQQSTRPHAEHHVSRHNTHWHSGQGKIPAIKPKPKAKSKLRHEVVAATTKQQSKAITAGQKASLAAENKKSQSSRVDQYASKKTVQSLKKELAQVQKALQVAKQNNYDLQIQLQRMELRLEALREWATTKNQHALQDEPTTPQSAKKMQEQRVQKQSASPVPNQSQSATPLPVPEKVAPILPLKPATPAFSKKASPLSTESHEKVTIKKLQPASESDFKQGRAILKDSASQTQISQPAKIKTTPLPEASKKTKSAIHESVKSTKKAHVVPEKKHTPGPNIKKDQAKTTHKAVQLKAHPQSETKIELLEKAAKDEIEHKKVPESIWHDLWKQYAMPIVGVSAILLLLMLLNLRRRQTARKQHDAVNQQYDYDNEDLLLKDVGEDDDIEYDDEHDHESGLENDDFEYDEDESIYDASDDDEDYQNDGLMDDEQTNTEQDPLADESHFDDDDRVNPEQQDIGTRLDLARAYIDLGDYQEAENILHGVIAEGNDEQVEAAEALLTRVHDARGEE